MNFFDEMGCEEVYEQYEQLAFDFGDEEETITFVTPNLLITAVHKDGKLVRSIGLTVKAEQVEMNYVKIRINGQEFFEPLSDKLRWMEEEEI